MSKTEIDKTEGGESIRKDEVATIAALDDGLIPSPAKRKEVAKKAWVAFANSGHAQIREWEK